MNKNPLLEKYELPPFSKIRAEHIEPAIDHVLAQNNSQLISLLASNPQGWEDLILPLEASEDYLQKVWGPINHLHGVLSSDKLRDAYHKALPKLTEYYTKLEQNQDLYQHFKKLAENKNFKTFDTAQQKLIKDRLRNFHLAGVTLSAEKKKRYGEIQTQLAKLSTDFEENVLDATESWTKHIEDVKLLAGVPDHVLVAAQQKAEEAGLSGWLLTLDYPCYNPIISYAKNRELRQEIYTAYVTRASDQGPQKGQHDNTKIMQEIMTLRTELSQLLGFNNYAELSLATKMLKKPEQVLEFLHELTKHVYPQAEKEFKELAAFAKTTDNLSDLHPWDTAYYSELLCQQQYGITDELLRPYFPLEKVLSGLFAITEELFGMKVVEKTDVDKWHPDVRFFALLDAKNNLRGEFYLDLYARQHKKGGAWMDDCRQRWRKADNSVQTPIAFLTCNLTPPNEQQISLLTHDEVLTIFHEYGHGLHHMLTQIDYLSNAGIRGVEWDAVELPSQLMEFFVWEKSGLDLISKHFATSSPLPESMLKSLRAAKNFHIGTKLLRQLEFSLFDFKLHLNFQPTKGVQQIQNILDDLRKEILILQPPTWNRFQHSFSHIFSGGYAAGYYSYLWAEMLACDAFAKFAENNVLNSAIGREFLHTILENGGAVEALELFKNFRGRDPNHAAFLKYFGLN